MSRRKTKKKGKSTAAQAAGAPAPEAKKPGKPRKWRRRAVRALVILFVLAVVLRIALPFAVPVVLDRIAANYGLTCDYEDMDLSLLTGDVRLWHLQLRPRPTDGEPDARSGPTVAHLEYAQVDIDVSALLLGAFRIHRIEVDGLDLLLERNVEGQFLLASYLPKSSLEDSNPIDKGQIANDPAPAGSKPNDEPREPADLRPPLRIDAARLQHVRIRVIDPSVQPAIDTWLEANVRISDIAVPERDTRLEILLHGPDLVDRLSVEGKVHASAERLEANLTLAADGIRPMPAAGWLRALGLHPHGDVLALQTRVGFAADRNDLDPANVDARLNISGTTLRSGTDVAASIERIEASVRGIGSDRLIVPDVQVSGIRGQAERLPDHTVRVAGFDLRTAPPAVPSPSPKAPRADTVPENATDAAVAMQLDRFGIRDVELRFRDRAVTPPVDLEFAMDELLLRELATDNPAQPSQLQVRGRVPGILESWELTAELEPFAPIIRLQSSVAASGITLGRLQPYLESMGLASTLQAGSFRGRIDATAQIDDDGVRAALDVREIQLMDGTEKLAVAAIAVRDVHADPAGSRIRVGAVEIQGASLGVQRSTEGSIHVLGLRTIAAAARTHTASPQDAPDTQPAVDPARPAGANPVTAREPTRFELGALRCRDFDLRFADDAVTPHRTFATTDFQFELLGLALGGEPDGSDPDIATLRLQLGISDVVASLSVDGSITTRRGPLDLATQLDLSAESISLLPLAPYLALAGIEPTLADGVMRAKLTATARSGSGASTTLMASARIQDVSFGPTAGEPFLALTDARAEDVVVGPDGVRATRILVDRPSLRLAREADGALAVAGVRIAAPPPTAAAAAVGTSSTTPVDPPIPTAQTTPTTTAVVDRFELRGANIAWSDAAVAPAVQTAVAVDVTADALSSVPRPEPMPFDVGLRVEGALDTLRIQGSATIGEERFLADARVDGTGLRAGPLAAYLPNGLAMNLGDGRFACSLRADVNSSRTAGSAELTIDDFLYRDGEQDALAQCKQIRVHAPLIDFTKRRLRVAEVAARGFELAVTRSAPGTISVLGMNISTAGEGSTTERPARRDVPVEAIGQTNPKDRSAVPAAMRSTKPLVWHVDLDKLDLELLRLRFVDRVAGRAGQPLDLRLRLQNAAPWVLIDPEPEELPPLRLAITGAANPLVDEIRVDLELAPFHADATAKLDLAIRGIHGAALAQILPAMTELDLADLRNGKFTAKAILELKLRRRYPTDLDFASGFGASVSVTEVALSDTVTRTADSKDTETVLIGVDGITIEAPRIVPGGVTHISSLEIRNPRGRVRKDATGFHVAGLRIPLTPAAAAQPTDTQPTDTAKPTTVTDTGPEPSQGPVVAAGSRAPRPEFRIDQLTVDGIDFVYRDESVNPPMVVPLTGLDVEVNKLTTKALTEDRSIKFSINLEAGEVRLPERQEASSALAGALTGIGKLVIGQSDKAKLESRRMLDELAVSGRLGLYPNVHGRIRTNLRGLELGALRGAAAESGVTIGDGVLDAGVEVRIDGPQSLSTRANFTLDHLVVDEKPGGPISTYLKLPAPLQTVVFALRDDAGEIGIPLDIAIEDAKVSAGQIASVAISTFSQLVAKAIAASPLRVTGTLTGLVGLTGGAEEEPGTLQQIVTFAPGDVEVGSSQAPHIKAIADALAADSDLIVELQHGFGKADIPRAELLANPTPEQARELIDRLRQRRAELDRDHGRLRAQALSHLGVGRTEAAERTLAQMRRVTKDLGEVEADLDRLSPLLRPGAERRKDKRTKRMAMEIGSERLEAVKQALLRTGGADLANRIEPRPVRIRAPETERGSVLLKPKIREVQASADEAKAATAKPVVDPGVKDAENE